MSHPVVAVATGTLLLDAGPAWAAGVNAASAEPPAVALFLRIVVLLATPVAVGLALAAPHTTRRVRPALTFTAVAAALCGVLGTEVDPAPVTPVALLAGATLVLPLLLGRPRTLRVAAVATWLLLAVRVGATAGADQPVIEAVRVAGLSAAISAAALVAVIGSLRRTGATALVAALLAAATATALAGYAAGVRPDRWAPLTWFGRLTVLAVVVVVAALVVAVLVLAHPDAPVRPAGVAGAMAALALVVAAVLPLLPPPPPPAVAGVPLLRTVNVGTERLPVLVSPNRPGWNLVQIGSAKASAGTGRTRLTAGTTRPGSTGSWVNVRLPAGASRLWIGKGTATGWLPVDTGHDRVDDARLTGPDGPECASASLGSALTGPARPVSSCPADGLSAEDAEALRAMVGFVAGRGVSAISVVGDDSPRGVRAVAEVRAAAAARGLPVADSGRHPLFVVAGWTGAEAVLRQVAGGGRLAEGSYLAPWLLTGPLLEIPAAPLLALRFDPRQADAARYLRDLDRLFPGAPATAVGYHRYLGDGGRRGELRLYAASALYVPGQGGHQHGAARSAWVPNGSVVPVTGSLPA
ncbi:hypothetical protein ACGFIG_24855 [Micromonospora sp. NPDC049048]|uniref:hypothetical protein n=1 Tax=Micromonospora sp. NPDC049048 TaxID=3364263 RepID=UPI003713BE9F